MVSLKFVSSHVKLNAKKCWFHEQSSAEYLLCDLLIAMIRNHNKW